MNKQRTAWLLWRGTLIALILLTAITFALLVRHLLCPLQNPSWVLSSELLLVAVLGIEGIIAWLHLNEDRAAQRDERLYDIIERLETESKRTLRNNIYGLRRKDFLNWPADQQDKIRAWGAELDWIAVLILSQRIDFSAFFSMYGDVVIRSAYQLAPFTNHQRVAERGQQFLLPLSNLCRRLLSHWEALAKNELFPSSISIPSQKIILSTQSLQEDSEFNKFLSPHRTA